MTNPNDPYGIIPRGVAVARVKSFDFQIRSMVDYDVNFLRDRVRSEIFVNGHPAGTYAVTALDANDVFGTDRASLQQALETFAPEQERGLVDEFMGLGYRKRVRALEIELKHLRDYVERDRWFHFVPVRRRYAEARLRVLGAWQYLIGSNPEGDL